MDLARTVYTREFKISAMRALEAGETAGQLARRLQVSPKRLERWRAEWRALGEGAFPGTGRRQQAMAADEKRRVGELERKIGQLTMENEFLKKAWVHFREHHPPAVVSGATACASKSRKRAQREGL
jgi:transposase